MEVAVEGNVESKDFLKISVESDTEETEEVPEISWISFSGLRRKLHKNDKEEQEVAEADEEEKKGEPDDEEKALMEAIFGNREKLFENLKDKPGKEEVDPKSKKRKLAWEDSDDEAVTIEQGLEKSHKKSLLLDPKTEYRKYLKKRYEKVVGEPRWARMDREESDSEDDDLLKTVGHVLKGKRGVLLENTIEFKRLKDLNRSTYSEGLVTSVDFHPTSSVALVTGLKGIASIYSIEKAKCDKLHSIQFRKYPMRCSRLSLDGSEAILGSSHTHFFTYNLITGQKQKHFLPRSMTKMAKFEISPDGELLAVVGRFGEIHILSAITKEWITTLKQEHEVSAITFSPDSKILYTHSVDSEVSIFSLPAQKMLHRFYDDGCLSGTSISMSPSGQFLATGSGQGIVNVYGADDVLHSQTPTPLKIFSNLVTGISSTAFNPSSELLAMCSDQVNDALKLAHFPGASIYANFPGNNLTKTKPNVVRFSPGGRYLAVGSINSRVSLYMLKHFEEF